MNDIKEKDADIMEEKKSFATYIWNPRAGEILGRTPTSWGKILVFYTIFYLCLAAFWAIMLLIFSTTIDDKEPKWKLDESRIGSNPGLGFRPRPPKERIESTLIRFRRNNQKSYEHWVKDLTTFLDSYTGNGNSTGGNYAGGADQPIDCDNNQRTSTNQFCYFDIRKISSECSASRQFGYSEGKPCILVKLNRIFDWEPQAYTFDQENDGSLPEELRNAIKNVGPTKNPMIYISCAGQNPIDKENIGQINYYPTQGIASYYFPFRNQDNYRSPFVLVQFASPSPGMILNVECKAWAKNIRHNVHEKEGSVHFELSVE